ncbi:MAG: heparinase II/III family protein [Rhodobacteraceae bacterium]|nr:heparinase II/III family protein [Paracoccaceae bacterium]
MEETDQASRSLGSRAIRSRVTLLDRLHARLSGLSRPATAFVSQPEPRTIGSFARGKQLTAGNFLVAGHLVEAPGFSIWALDWPDEGLGDLLHGFTWLDDLAAAGDAPARRIAQDWLGDWIARYGRGAGPGWTPDLTGRRLIRWINHAVFVLHGRDREFSDAYFRALGRQTRFLARRWHSAPPGLPRFEALTGVIYAGLALEGMEGLVAQAVRAIADECAAQIDGQGGIPSRNPEELLEVFTLLVWAAGALREAGRTPLGAHLMAIERIAPTLRSLRHSDGTLARFHGGDIGPEGRLDAALAASGVRTAAATGQAMGFARLSAGRTSVIVDAASPPAGIASREAHAGTLAFELTSGRRPLVVNCGPGTDFGPAWRRAARATPMHSTLAVHGYSSSRLAPQRIGRRAEAELLVDRPRDVRLQQSAGPEGTTLLASHDGYRSTHGLWHVRRLDLAIDGGALSGEDTLAALSAEERAIFDKALDRTSLQGIGFAIRFHLHPEVEARIDMGGTAVSLTLRSGEIWVFRHDGVAELTVEPDVYLEKGRLRPRAAQQVVLSCRVIDYGRQVTWSLARAHESGRHIRDLTRDPLPTLY